MIVEQDGFFYPKEYPKESNYGTIQSMYESLYGDLEIDQSDRILHINGMDVIEWLTDYANLYDYSSKSDNGRVNSELSGALYNKRLDVYNVPAEKDQSIEIQYLSGRTQTVHFVVKTSAAISDSAAARKLYEAEIKTVSPYEAATKAVKLNARKPTQPYKLFEHEEPLVFLKEQNRASEDFTLLLSSEDYFNLYQYKNQDLVLAITSFSPSDIETALNDTVRLLEKIREKLTSSSKLYISVLGNGGGWVSLGHLLANGLFPTEYPIYGRYNIRKSSLAESLLKSGSAFEDMHRFEWITGETYTNSSFINDTVNMTWYQKTIGNTYTDYYGFDDDQDPTVASYTKKIYAMRLNITPAQTILLTDSQCGSTCSCFSKHLLQMKNVYAIGFGGAYQSTDAFDVSSFAGGAVMDSQEYETSVMDLAANGFPHLSDEEINELKAYWIPHNGYLRFAHHIIYSFDSTEDAGVPLEYRSVPVNAHYPIYPSFVDW